MAAAVGVGAGVAAAAPVILATGVTLAASMGTAAVFGSGCAQGISMYKENDCKNASYFDFVCAMVKTYTISNCGGAGNHFCDMCGFVGRVDKK